MSQQIFTRPDSSEHHPYYGKYVQLVPEENIVEAIDKQIPVTKDFLQSLSESLGEKRYAPGKWTIKEVIGHMTDTERLFIQRALFFARNHPAPLPGYEPDDWNNVALFNNFKLKDLVDEFVLLRKSSLYFFKHLNENDWLKRGIASEREFSVRALAYISLGHERHHIDILKTRYLND